MKKFNFVCGNSYFLNEHRKILLRDLHGASLTVVDNPKEADLTFEASKVSLFGSDRVVRVNGANPKLSDALLSIVIRDLDGIFFLFEFEDQKIYEHFQEALKSFKDRCSFELSKTDNKRDVKKFIASECERLGISLNEEAVETLVGFCEDANLIGGELQKLFVLNEGVEFTKQDIVKYVGMYGDGCDSLEFYLSLKTNNRSVILSNFRKIIKYNGCESAFSVVMKTCEALLLSSFFNGDVNRASDFCRKKRDKSSFKSKSDGDDSENKRYDPSPTPFIFKSVVKLNSNKALIFSLFKEGCTTLVEFRENGNEQKAVAFFEKMIYLISGG